MANLISKANSNSAKSMKQFLVFYGSIYYPSGGMDDFIGDYDNIDDAIAAVNKAAFDDRKYKADEKWEYAWGHIYDTNKREQVWSK